jgi:hypothetical protein
VDWGSAGSGPADIDTGHCRLNLAILFGADWAELQFIPVQVNGRARVDVAGMTGRVEELLQTTLRRL